MASAKTRRPAAAGTWHQRVLLSYEPGTYPQREAARLTADPRLAASYWLPVGQDANPDLYAQEQGADFDIIDYDGTWADMFEQVCAAWDEARDAAEAGYPSALIVTSMTGVHAMLNDTADRRARRQHAAALTARGLDPAAAFSSEVHVEIHADLWKLMNRRHAQLMGKILTWPGPVVMTARETRTPDSGWHLRASDQLGFDVTCWVRLTRDEPPEIVLLDTAQHQRLTRSERAALRSEFTLPKLIWEWSGCDSNTRAPEPRTFDADQVLPGEQPVRMLQAVKTVRPASSARRRAAAATSAAPAENVDSGEPLPPEVRRAAADFADEWLNLSARGQVQDVWDRMIAQVGGALQTDIAGLLLERDRKALGVADGEAYTLDDLATRAALHVRRTGTALRPAEAGVAS